MNGMWKNMVWKKIEMKSHNNVNLCMLLLLADFWNGRNQLIPYKYIVTRRDLRVHTQTILIWPISMTMKFCYSAREKRKKVTKIAFNFADCVKWTFAVLFTSRLISPLLCNRKHFINAIWEFCTAIGIYSLSQQQTLYRISSSWTWLRRVKLQEFNKLKKCRTIACVGDGKCSISHGGIVTLFFVISMRVLEWKTLSFNWKWAWNLSST